MKVTILASGSKANSMVVSCGDTHVLLDAGLGAKQTFRRMLEAGIRPESLAAVLISHEHGDHVGGLPGITGKLMDLPIYLTQGTLGAMKWGEFRAPRVMVFQSGATFKIRDMEVRTFSVPHDAADPVGYSITCGGARFAMATDLGKITANVKRGLSGADVVFIESNHDIEMLEAGPYPEHLRKRVLGPKGHLSNVAVADWLREGLSGTSQVILGHLSSGNNHEELCRLTALDAIAGRCDLKLAGTEGGLS